MKKQLNDFFLAGKNARSKQRLFSSSELRRMVENAPQQRVTKHYLLLNGITIMISLIILAASIAAVFFALNTAPHQAVLPRDTVAKEEIRQQIISPAISSEPKQQNSTFHAQGSLLPLSINRAGDISTPMTIEGIHFLEMSDQELNKIGIARTDMGYSLYAVDAYRFDDTTLKRICVAVDNKDSVFVEISMKNFKEAYANFYGGDTTQPFAELKQKITLNTIPGYVHSELLLYPDAAKVIPKISPLLISSSYKAWNDKEGYIIEIFHNPSLADSSFGYTDELLDMHSKSRTGKYPLLSKLIPVYMVAHDPREADELAKKADFVLWYYPSEEFLNVLPKELAEQIRKERDLTTMVEEGIISQEEVTKRYCGEYNYMQMCRAQGGPITITSIIPNPIQNETTVYFRMMEQRAMKVALYDVSGHKVMDINDAEFFSIKDQYMGLHMNLGRVPTGTYLIAIITDRGEQAVQRLIVQH